MGRTLAYAMAVAGVALMAGSVAVFGVRGPAATGPATPVFTEIKWPFLLDAWGVGKAFACAPASCGVQVEVFIRPKIGFCNCSTGVSDEQELERVADTDLVSDNPQPLGAARPIKVAWMKGLSRSYWVSDRDATGRLLSIAFNDECDAVVALATVGEGDPAALEPAVIAFLNTEPVVQWVKKELGLEYVKRVW